MELALDVGLALLGLVVGVAQRVGEAPDGVQRRHAGEAAHEDDEAVAAAADVHDADDADDDATEHVEAAADAGPDPVAAADELDDDEEVHDGVKEGQAGQEQHDEAVLDEEAAALLGPADAADDEDAEDDGAPDEDEVHGEHRHGVAHGEDGRAAHVGRLPYGRLREVLAHRVAQRRDVPHGHIVSARW